MASATQFHCTILSAKNTIFEQEVTSVFVTGDRSEYELLAYHYPVIGLVQKGNIVIDGDKEIPIRSGILKFFANECTILIQESDQTYATAKKIQENWTNAKP